ncbi:unnamed protein product [Moneuplotes crassus]|uniref:HhH-GPD domain-containing protein n=1 Tax=Euplotes crassus TaxID=5936 RepID=A0AAD1XU20_EUPCR|nr:unnamed protein product [Moneuplotes crassus]
MISRRLVLTNFRSKFWTPCTQRNAKAFCSKVYPHPQNWEEVWKKIEDANKQKGLVKRSKGDLPLFQVGTEQEKDYKCLLRFILMSMTKNNLVDIALNNILDHSSDPEVILETPDEEISEMIKNVRFHNKKIGYIKKSTKMFLENFEGRLPSDIKSLNKFPGIGPVSSLMISQMWFNKVQGIAVDSHIIRCAKLLGWADGKTTAVVRKQLESWLPKEKWGDLYFLLVFHGSEICTPRKPKCDSCSVRDLCPSSTYDGPTK